MTLEPRSLILLTAFLASGCAEPFFRGRESPEPVREQPPAARSPEVLTGGQTPKEPAVEIAPRETLPGDGAREVIDLVTALRLAGAQNIDVLVLKERLDAARANLDAATALFLPELSLGAGYVRHDGRFQETRGDVFDVSRSSLAAGPGVRLHLDPAEAHFERLRAHETHDAVRHAGERTRAEAVVHSAVLYLDLLKARGNLEVARDAVSHSQAQARLSEEMVGLRAELRVTLARARAELARDQERLLRATNDLQRASVELAVWLRLSPTRLLVPAEERIEPTELVDPDTPVDDLVAKALSSRPDLQELQALQRAAQERLGGALWGPLAPSVDVFAGYGAFGGGRGSFSGDFADRGDYGAALTWRFEGLGFTEAARYRRARAEARETALRLEGLKKAIVGQVIRTRDEALNLRSRISAARSRVEAAREAMDLVRSRFQAGDAIQLEVLQAAREMAESRGELIGAIIGFNQVQHLFYYQVRGDSWSGRSAGTILD